MYDADTQIQHDATHAHKRKGGSFFAIDRAVWEHLWSLETANRLHFVTAFLVLSAGTGADHRLTKWSAKAIEEHVGIGKPRGQRAIQELVDHGLITRTDQSTRLFPQYRLPVLDRDSDPIFLPVQLITGFGSETPILRRIREVGDPHVLRMLVDLYALVEVDATYAVPIASLSLAPTLPARKLFEAGVNAVWALERNEDVFANGSWAAMHLTYDEDPWEAFHARLNTLRTIGALVFEAWIFDGDTEDAEPMFPVNPEFLYVSDTAPSTLVTRQACDAAVALAGERSRSLQCAEDAVLIPLPVHHRAPAIRGVARLRIEADTPGRRLAFAQRMTRLEAYGRAFMRLKENAYAGEFGKVLRPDAGAADIDDAKSGDEGELATDPNWLQKAFVKSV